MRNKLKKQLGLILHKDIDLEIKNSSYAPKKLYSNAKISNGTYYILLDKEIIWEEKNIYTFHCWSILPDIIANYINTPIKDIIEKDFTITNYYTRFDTSGLIEILIASDRRFGKGKLFAWYMSGNRSIAAGKILSKRFNK